MNTFTFNTNANIPPPVLNGGLYTGTSFDTGAPWGNVYVRPSSAFLVNQMLPKKDNGDFKPPSSVYYHMTPGFRPGNNTDDSFMIQKCDNELSCVNVRKCKSEFLTLCDGQSPQ